jgi:hypothetical protein
MVMKPLLVFLLILIFSKGTESNPLLSKLWPFNDYQKVTYDYHSYNKYFDKLFLKIAYLFKDYSIFNDFSYKITKTENEAKLEYRCKSSYIGGESFVFHLEKQWVNSYNVLTIEKCLEHLIGCSPNNIESLIDFIKNKVTTSSTFLSFFTSSTFFSISKALPDQHNLTINNFINDQSIVQLKHHVKLALLYVDEENYFLKTDDKKTTQYKLGNTEKQPTLYILYDAVKEKKGKNPVEGEEHCIMCDKKVTNEYTLSYKSYFQYPSPIYAHMKCFYWDIKNYNGNLEELLRQEKMFNFFDFLIQKNYRTIFLLDLFNRFFNFEKLMEGESLIKYFNDLYLILYPINKFNGNSKELVDAFNNSKDKSYNNFANGERFKNLIWNFFRDDYKSLSKNLMNSPYSDISEIGKPIGLKLKLLISKVYDTEASNNVKEILKLTSDIDNELRMLTPMIHRIILQNIAELIKKYDFIDSSMENLLALE